MLGFGISGDRERRGQDAQAPWIIGLKAEPIPGRHLSLGVTAQLELAAGLDAVERDLSRFGGKPFQARLDRAVVLATLEQVRGPFSRGEGI